MNRRRVVALFVFGAMALALPAARAAEPAPVTGVWWQLEPSDGAVPPAESVPRGGLWFQASPAGATATSAVRFPVPGGRVPSKVSLTINTERAVAGPLAVDACPPETAWQPPQQSPGTFAERPVPNCSTHDFVGTVTNGVITFDVRSLGSVPEVDLVLVPAAGSDSFIDVTFDAPIASALSTAPASPPAPAPATPIPAPSSAGSSIIPVPSPESPGLPAATGTPAATGLGAPAVPAIESPALAAPAGSNPVAAPVAAAAPAGQVSDRVATTTKSPIGRGAAFWWAAGCLLGILLWIAAVISRALQTGAGFSSAGYTIYRGARPAAEKRNDEHGLGLQWTSPNPLAGAGPG